MASVLLIAPILVLVLMQGGFYPLHTCVVGTVVCVAAVVAWVRSRERGQKLPIAAALLVLVAVLQLVSALVAGPTLTTITGAAVWASCAGMGFLAACQTEEGRSASLRALGWCGVITAVAGAFVMAGVLPLHGGTIGSRLQFTFQYANVTAAWYGATFFVCAFSDDRLLPHLACAPFAALFLTESRGALLVVAALCVVACVVKARAGSKDAVFNILTQVVFGLLGFALTAVIPSFGAAAAIPAVSLASLLLGPRLQERLNGFNIKRVLILLFVALAVVGVACLIVFGDRIASGVTSLLERMAMVRDAITLWLSSPLIGIGPNNWQYRYQAIQTAPYYTTVVHSSLIQLLLDCGILGLAAFVGACFFGLRGMLRDFAERPAEVCATSLILLHALIEFDLSFSSIAFLLAFLLCGPSSPKLRVSGLAAGLAGVAICLPLCVVGAYSSWTSTAITQSAATGDYEACARFASSSPLAQNDPSAQSRLLESAFNAGDYRKVAQMYGGLPFAADVDAYRAAMANYYLGDQEAAGKVFVGLLEAQPNNIDFAHGAKELVDEYGLPVSVKSKFEELVRATEERAATCGWEV